MNQVDPAFVAVHVKLHPQTWNRWISMRVELFGCPGILCHNRPFPSSLGPLFQSESKCEIILKKMTLICMKMKLPAEFIFI